MTSPAMNLLMERVQDALAEGPKTVLTLAREIHGAYRTHDDVLATQQALGNLRAMGAVRVSGVTYSLTPNEETR